MKTFKQISIVLFSIILIASCGELSKELAKDELVGNYKGKVTYQIKFSQFNLGIPDSRETQDCIVEITKTEYGIYLNTVDGKIGINNITLLTNGAQFNIYEQTISTIDNQKIKLIGNTIYSDSEGNKVDGQYNKDINSLQFSFQGTGSYNLSGLDLEIPMIVFYELSKY
jgi:hypothetical protein